VLQPDLLRPDILQPDLLQPDIRDLGLIGDRRTVALVTRARAVVWYCPGRFDEPSLLAALLDAGRGGAWTLEGADLSPTGRRYQEESGVLETRLALTGGELTLTDFMPLGERTPRGLCRLVSEAPSPRWPTF
jgi:GH15 family glucan-1,4-alpha-glucosidase